MEQMEVIDKGATATVLKDEPKKNPTVFDRTGEFTIPIRIAKKSVTVSFPADEQFCRRQAMIRITFKRYGMEGTQTLVDGEERADLELFNAIKKSGDNLDGAEATTVIERLLRAEPGEPERDGDHFVIPIVVTGGIRTTHKLREPSIAELRKHRRSATTTIDGRHGSELKSSPAAFGSFYDDLVSESTGYLGEVPVSHKMVAVRELVAAVSRIENEDEPGNFN